MKTLLYLALTAGAVIGGLYLLDVFTWHGLAYSFGLGDGAELLWPTGTRALTLTMLATGVVTGTVALVAHLDWRDAVYEPRDKADRLAIVPTSMRRRVKQRVAWWWGGVQNLRRQTARRAMLARPMIEAGTSLHAQRDAAARDDQAA